MDSAALGASSARPTGHSRGLGTAASIVGAARWRISPPSEIQRFLIWMQSLMPNPWGKYDMMKSFSRQNNTWRLVQGPILHIPIARLWFYSHRAPLYKLAAQRSKIFFLWFYGGSIRNQKFLHIRKAHRMTFRSIFLILIFLGIILSRVMGEKVSLLNCLKLCYNFLGSQLFWDS